MKCECCGNPDCTELNEYGWCNICVEYKRVEAVSYALKDIVNDVREGCKWCGETCDEPDEMFCSGVCANRMEFEAHTYLVTHPFHISEMNKTKIVNNENEDNPLF